MSSEIAERKRDISNELNDIQSDYRRRKSELLENQQLEIQNIKENFESQRNSLEDSNQAAINHIKKSHANEIENVKDQTEQHLQNTKEQTAKSYQSFKKYADSNIKNLEDQVHGKEKDIEGRISQLNEKESYQRDQIQKNSTNFYRKQAEKFEDSRQKIQKQMDEIATHGSEERRKAINKHQIELTNLENEYDKKKAVLVTSREKVISQEKEAARLDLAKTQDYNQRRIAQEKIKGEENIHNIRTHFDVEGKRTEEKATTNLENLRKSRDERIEYEKGKGQVEVAKTQEQYQKQLNETRNMGEHKIIEDKAINQKKLQRQTDYYEGEISRTKKNNDQRLVSEDKQYNETFNKNAIAHRENLRRQNQKFQSSYLGNQKQQNESLNIQRDLFSKQILEDKKQMISQVNKYDEIASDPFYKIENRDSSFIETPEAYIIKTFVPPHEKDKVKLRVHEDRAVISGARSFKDELQSDERKVKTNSFQTFHEEFKFDKPVSQDFVKQERDGDYMKFVIPKLAMSGKLPSDF